MVTRSRMKRSGSGRKKPTRLKTVKTVQNKKFEDLRNERDFGMVVMGAGGKPTDWAEGISKILKKENIVDKSSDTFSKIYKLTDNVKGKAGRSDIVLIFDKKSKPNIGKLAIWRLKFGSVSWIDDFVRNYSNDYKSG